jgi:hypothetical protein
LAAEPRHVDLSQWRYESAGLFLLSTFSKTVKKSSTPDQKVSNHYMYFFWQDGSSPQTYHIRIVVRYFEVRYLVYYQFTV